MTEGAHWALALLPVLVLLGIFVWLDAFALMSLREVVLLLLLGGICAIAAYPVSGRLLDQLPIGFSLYSRFVAPWIEEAIKGAAIVLLFRLNRIGYKPDAVISGFAIGAGFSVVENIFYLATYPEYGLGTWMVRGLGTAVMHGTVLALLAAIAHEFAERENRASAGEYDFSLLWFLPGYGAAVALHMAFNQFPDRPMLAMMGAMLVSPLLLIGIFHFGTAEAAAWLDAEATAHRAELEALRAGRWPDTGPGRRIAALADRLGPEAANAIRSYWENQAYLVVEAEEAMLEEAAGDATSDRERIAAAFAELARLRGSLGPSAFAALAELLPFSRNDHWEVAELRQRTGVSRKDFS